MKRPGSPSAVPTASSAAAASAVSSGAAVAVAGTSSVSASRGLLALLLWLRRQPPLLPLAVLALLAGLLLLCATLLQPLAEARALQARLAERRAELRALTAATSGGTAGAAAAGSARTDPLADRLGEASATDAALRRVFDAARAAGLSLDAGDHLWQPLPDAGLVAWTLKLPVQGPYAALRDFTDRVLLDLPFAALDQLAVKRENVEQDQVSATLQFTLLMQAGEADLAGAAPVVASPTSTPPARPGIRR